MDTAAAAAGPLWQAQLLRESIHASLVLSAHALAGDLLLGGADASGALCEEYATAAASRGGGGASGGGAHALQLGAPAAAVLALLRRLLVTAEPALAAGLTKRFLDTPWAEEEVRHQLLAAVSAAWMVALPAPAADAADADDADDNAAAAARRGLPATARRRCCRRSCGARRRHARHARRGRAPSTAAFTRSCAGGRRA